jgi:hypothetical protein
MTLAGDRGDRRPQLKACGDDRVDVSKPTISNRRMVLALLCAAVTGWLCAVAPLLFGALFEQGLREVLAGMVLFAIFGLPFALFATFIVGLPLALAARENGWTSLRHTILFGLGGGFAIWAGSLSYRLLSSAGSWGGSDGYLWEDGWPTALGWQQELADAPLTAIIGLISAMVAWRVAIPRAGNRSALK